jgi:hypothetical protein
LARTAKNRSIHSDSVPLTLILKGRYQLLEKEMREALGEVDPEECRDRVNDLIHSQLPAASTIQEVTDDALKVRELKAGRMIDDWKPTKVLDLLTEGENFEAELTTICQKYPNMGIRVRNLVSALESATDKSNTSS